MALDLIVIALVVAADPIPLTAFVIVLSSRNGVKKGAAFLVGWLLSLVAVVVITVVATGNDPPKSNTAPAVAALVVKLVLGVVLVGFGVRHQRRLSQPRPPKKTPKWQSSVDSMSMLYACGLAPLVQPWGLLGAGAATITQAKVSSVQSALILVLFCLLASSSVIGLELYARFSPQKAGVLLKGVLSWFDRNTDRLVVIGSITAGLYLMGSSIYYLVVA